MSRVKNEKGNKYGNLTVLERAGSKNGKATWWVQCNCGRSKPFEVSGDSLRRGHKTGCNYCDLEKQKQLMSNIGKQNASNLVGQKFGKLTVLKRVENRIYKNGKSVVMWKCLCDCGNIHYVESSNLKSGKVKSCGCLLSDGERIIKHILQKNNIKFYTQYTPKDWKYQNYYPIFDFVLLNENNTLLCAIEYNGQQHYTYNLSSSKYNWNNKENYEKCLERDKLKRGLCYQYNLPLYEISYKEKENLENIILKICQNYELLV